MRILKRNTTHNFFFFFFENRLASLPYLVQSIYRYRGILEWLGFMESVFLDACDKFYQSCLVSLVFFLCGMHSQSFSHVWLCKPMDCSPPFSVHGIFQARILEWVNISSSWGSSKPRDWTCVSCVSCIGRRFLPPCHLESFYLNSFFWERNSCDL